MGSTSRSPQVICFGDRSLDLQTAELRLNGDKIVLQDQPFRILIALLETPGQIVTREDLIKRLWPDGRFVEFNQSLNKAVGRLREALEDSADEPRFVETLPRRGYRWIGPIPTNAAEHGVSESAEWPRKIDKVEAPAAVKDADGRARPYISFGWKALVGLAVIIVGVTLASFLRFPRRQVLTEKDTILLAEFQNRTGNPVFDETLKQALAIELAQSPILNIFPEQGVRETLQYMGRSPNEKITPDIARDICQRQGIKAILRGSISNLGRKYVIALDTRNCLTGDALTQQEEVVDSPEHALRGLERAATSLRERLGESLSSIQKFDVPLEQATTSSLEALQAYSFARQKLAQGGDTWDALPFLERATEVDPDFAMAHATLGEIYSSGGPMSNDEFGRKYLTKAFGLRNRVSDHERFYIVSSYYENVTRELGKAIDNYELWKWVYPRDVDPYDGLAGIYISTGQFERAAELARTALQLRPGRAQSYERMAFIYTYLGRFNEARSFCEQAVAKGIDGPRMHWRLYMIAFLQNDIGGMQRELDWHRAHGETTRLPFYQALVAASSGQLHRSEQLFQETMDSLADHDKEGAALAAVQLALIEAHFGYGSRGRRRAAESLKLLPSNIDLGSLALAVAGDYVAAQETLDHLLEAFPEDTLLKNVIAPVVAAQANLNHGHPDRAIDLLRSAQPYEFGADNAGRGLMTIYLRGEAHLQMHAGKDAATEFQKIIDHPGIDPFSPLHALAYLGRARAYALDDDHTRARDAYQEFFSRWKDADVDLPILAQSRAEYAKLH